MLNSIKLFTFFEEILQFRVEEPSNDGTKRIGNEVPDLSTATSSCTVLLKNLDKTRHKNGKYHSTDKVAHAFPLLPLYDRAKKGIHTKMNDFIEADDIVESGRWWCEKTQIPDYCDSDDGYRVSLENRIQ